jgi:hypothetical protein
MNDLKHDGKFALKWTFMFPTFFKPFFFS